MPTVLVIAGPNGAGKSTIAPGIVGAVLGRAEFLNADRIARGLAATERRNVDFVAGRVLLERIRTLVNEGQNFAFESTLSSRSFAPFLTSARAQGFRVVIAYVWPGSADVAVARVRQREQEGGHGIPEAVVRRRYRRSLSNFVEFYQPLVDEWIVFANRDGLLPRIVARGTSGDRTVIYDGAVWDSVRSLLDDDDD